MQEKNLFSNPFVGMSKEKLMQRKSIYEKIIAEQSPNYIVPINPRTNRPFFIPKLDYMVPHWQKGLDMINELLEK